MVDEPSTCTCGCSGCVGLGGRDKDKWGQQSACTIHLTNRNMCINRDCKTHLPEHIISECPRHHPACVRTLTRGHNFINCINPRDLWRPRVGKLRKESGVRSQTSLFPSIVPLGSSIWKTLATIIILYLCIPGKSITLILTLISVDH